MSSGGWHDSNEATRLTVRKRSCLLRAARARLTELHKEYGALRRMEKAAGPSSRLSDEIALQCAEVVSEIGCLAEGIRWLWSQPTVD